MARGMGAFAAVAQGSHEDPQLIVLRYEPVGLSGPRLGFVGKAVTFDTGGISIKPAAKMAEMKFDMSGGAAVIEAVAAIARLGLPVRVLGVVGATENMPSGHAVKPGDIVTAMNGTTIEVNNTDAEGRMVLADCLAHAVAEGAERLVDLATLTGAVIVALGSVNAGLMGDDDGWCEEVEQAARTAGEPAWRLPLSQEYADMIKGRYGDIVNSTTKREAMSITAGEFLHRFTADVPWVHLDIAGVAWDRGKPYAAKGGAGWGVRTLVELARRAGRSLRPRRLRPAEPGRPCAIGAARASRAVAIITAMDFDLSDDHQLIRSTVRDFAEGEIAPVAEELDREKRFPYDIVRQLGDLDLMGIPFPEEYGGAGGDTLAYALAVEELTRVDSSVGDHDVRAHVAGHAADLPVRLRGAEAALPARSLCRAQARRLRPDRARGGLGRRQHAHPRPPGRRRVGDRRRQAVHHQRRHRHLRPRGHHRAHRRRRDLEPHRRERHARLRAGRAVPQDGLERFRHAAR